VKIVSIQVSFLNPEIFAIQLTLLQERLGKVYEMQLVGGCQKVNRLIHHKFPFILNVIKEEL
jgi:hypothetical protein